MMFGNHVFVLVAAVFIVWPVPSLSLRRPFSSLLMRLLFSFSSVGLKPSSTKIRKQLGAIDCYEYYEISHSV